MSVAPQWYGVPAPQHLDGLHGRSVPLQVMLAVFGAHEPPPLLLLDWKTPPAHSVEHVAQLRCVLLAHCWQADEALERQLALHVASPLAHAQ